MNKELQLPELSLVTMIGISGSGKSNFAKNSVNTIVGEGRIEHPRHLSTDFTDRFLARLARRSISRRQASTYGLPSDNDEV